MLFRWQIFLAHLLAAALGLAALRADAQTLRIATYNVELDRKGPGLLLRDILRGDDQITAVAQVVAATDPDVLVLQNVDYDHGLVALTALRDFLAQGGPNYPHIFALRPNAGMATGLDMNGDGYLGDADDKQGFGAFAGQGGMAILSKLPIDHANVQDFSDLLWRDLPGNIMPHSGGVPFPSAQVAEVQRLASVGLWSVPVQTAQGPLHILAFHAGPAVFDGAEDRNGRRNHDEMMFWVHYLKGTFGPPPEHFVLAGAANLDPTRGEGRKEAIFALLQSSRITDVKPMRQSGPNSADQLPGDAAFDTVFWPAPGPGGRRVDYVLPSSNLTAQNAGIHWPPEDTETGQIAAAASRHRIVWVDIELPK